MSIVAVLTLGLYVQFKVKREGEDWRLPKKEELHETVIYYLNRCNANYCSSEWYGEIITNALLDVGIEGSTIHAAMGVGIRERLGALGVAVDAEREVVSVVVSSDEVDRVFERIF